MNEVMVYSLMAVTTGVFGFAAALQTMLSPDDTWISLTVVVGLFVVSLGATVKVVRLIDRITRNQKRIMKELDLEDE